MPVKTGKTHGCNLLPIGEGQRQDNLYARAVEARWVAEGATIHAVAFKRIAEIENGQHRWPARGIIELVDNLHFRASFRACRASRFLRGFHR